VSAKEVENLKEFYLWQTSSNFLSTDKARST
jgi:hypothetical protein